MRLGALARRPHELMEMELEPAEALAFDMTVLRASENHRAIETSADMQELGNNDEMGIGRVIGLLFKQLVRGK